MSLAPPAGPRRRHPHSLSYDLYLRSSLWQLRRYLWWRREPNCELCGCPLVLHRRDLPWPQGQTQVLTVHHRNYRRLWHERRSDVELLCWHCHKVTQLAGEVW